MAGTKHSIIAMEMESALLALANGKKNSGLRMDGFEERLADEARNYNLYDPSRRDFKDSQKTGAGYLQYDTIRYAS